MNEALANSTMVKEQSESIENSVEYLGVEKLEEGNKKIEVFALSRGDWEQVVYVYQDRNNEFLFFASVWELVQFFQPGGEPIQRFISDESLHMFMRRWRGK